MTLVKELSTLAEFDRVLESSRNIPQLIFKHSTSCPVSAAAFQEFLEFIKEHVNEDGLAFSLVKVIESRPVSNEIAARLTVRHESPQVILVQDGRAVWNESHHRIKKAELKQVAAELG
ncbi:MAG: bacillithiol system redox-active protein YtxJ [Firmicutes bacterium]|nr:bacillithiol system redox-active protein YtxJ [Bacillota bacterium]